MLKHLVILCAVIAALVAADLTPLGTMTVDSGLTWDNNTETNLAGYNIYVSPQADTNWVKVATVTTNVWRGDSTKDLNGYHKVYLTAFNDRGLESKPSDIVLIRFIAGVPQSPTRIQLYNIVRLAATNSAPSLPPIP